MFTCLWSTCNYWSNRSWWTYVQRRRNSSWSWRVSLFVTSTGFQAGVYAASSRLSIMQYVVLMNINHVWKSGENVDHKEIAEVEEMYTMKLPNDGLKFTIRCLWSDFWLMSWRFRWWIMDQFCFLYSIFKKKSAFCFDFWFCICTRTPSVWKQSAPANFEWRRVIIHEPTNFRVLLGVFWKF